MVSRGGRLTAVVALGAALAVPSSAQAARVDLNGSVLRWRADDSLAHSMAVAVRPGEVTFSEPGRLVDVTRSGGRCGFPVGGTVTCLLAAGNQVLVELGDGDDQAEATGGPVWIDGGKGDDRLIGGWGDDHLRGGDGNDVLQGRGGRDTYEGDGGTDTIDYSDHGTPVTANFDGVANDGAAGENELVPADAEYLVGGQGGDTLTAASGGSTLDGGPGPDLLIGGPGADTIFGGRDGDELRGGGGVDRLAGELGPDRIYSSDGNSETVQCGDGQDWVRADPLDALVGCETFVLVGGAGGGAAGGATGGPAGGGSGTGSGSLGTSAPGGTTGGGGSPAPPPQIGRSVGVEPTGGTVVVHPPGEDPAKLSAGDAIPVGSVVDTTHGTVSLTAAADADGKTQTAQFHGGVFKVAQTGGSRPLTELVLTAPLSCGGGDGAARTAASGSSSRRLWGSGHGRFRTRGRGSSATVRGTIWLTEDRCDGTFTRVKRGIVAVRDFKRHRTKLVPAGHSYLARR